MPADDSTTRTDDSVATAARRLPQVEGEFQIDNIATYVVCRVPCSSDTWSRPWMTTKLWRNSVCSLHLGQNSHLVLTAAEQSLTNLLVTKSPGRFQQHFIETVFYLNGQLIGT